MKTRDLIKALDTLDKQGIWAFRYSSLKLRFRQSDRALLKSLSAHQKNGYVLKVAKGLYVNPRARSLPPDILPALVPWLRPFEMNYVSLESALKLLNLVGVSVIATALSGAATEVHNASVGGERAERAALWYLSFGKTFSDFDAEYIETNADEYAGSVNDL